MNFYIDYIQDLLSIKTEAYISEPVNNIIFSYKIKEGIIESRIINTKPPVHNYYNTKLPLSNNPKDYGRVLLQTENKRLQAIAMNRNTTIIIEECKDGAKRDRKYNYVKFLKNNNILYEWSDYYINEYTFERQLGKSSYKIENGEIVLTKIIKSSNNIKPIQTENNLNNKFISPKADVETILINKIHTPYLLCWYDGEVSKSYYITDFNAKGDWYLLVKRVMTA